jgi:hypothetical protein
MLRGGREIAVGYADKQSLPCLITFVFWEHLLPIMNKNENKTEGKRFQRER